MSRQSISFISRKQHCPVFLLHYLGLFLISFTLSILIISTIRIKYIVYDEAWFAKTGTWLLKNSLSDNPHLSKLSYPPLLMTIQSIPAYFLNHSLPKEFHLPIRELFPYTMYNHKKNKMFLYSIRDAIFWFRLPAVFLWFLLLIITYLWSKNLYGYSAAFFALFILILDPNLIAHSSIATADFGSTTLMCAALYCFYRFLKRTDVRLLLLSGITLGLALASKYYAIELLFIYLVLIFVKAHLEKLDFKKALRLLRAYVLIVCIAFIILNFLYIALNAVPSYSPLTFLIPYNYIHGLASRIAHFQYGPLEYSKFYFLMGNYSPSGWWYYFFIVFLIKTPIPLLIFLMIRFSRGFKNTIDEASVIIPITIHLLLISGFNHINTGIRHMLFIYPLLIIWVSQIGKTCKNGLPAAVLGLLLCWYIAANVFIFPNYLAYFNESIGGPKNGYKYLAESNMDCGQDEILVFEYIHSHRKRIFVKPRRERTGKIMVNVNALVGIDRETHDKFNWLKHLSPTETVGYSWLVYDVDSSSKTGPSQK